jgi:protein O-mannosyl-transferase
VRYLRIFLTILLLIAAARLALLFVSYISGSYGVQRHHLESTGTLFVVLAFLLRYVIGTASNSETRAGPAAGGRVWLAFCVLGLALYWPSLSIGLLSDDYVLVQRAAALDVSAVSSTLFRPIPLLAWAFVLELGGGAATLHLLNVVLHATNAYLAAIVVGEWLPGGRERLLAGLLVLVAPLAPEAVAWCSGVFDVSATLFVLSGIALSKRYVGPGPAVGARLAFVLLGLGAVLCKETAAIGPLLVLLCAWLNGRVSKRLLVDLALVIVAIGLYGGLRLAANPEPSLFAVSKYAVQRALFTAFGSLAVPYHMDLQIGAPWLPITGVMLSLALWTRFSAAAGPMRHLAVTAGGLAWVLIAILPAWSILVVPADLQASRFLYLAATGWPAVMLVPAVSVARPDTRMKLAGTMAIATLVVLNAAATRMHLRPWEEAGQLRGRVLHAAAANERIRSCSDVAISDAPDNVRGAYVFRNGLAEAFQSRLGIPVVGSPRTAGCAFRWTPEGTFIAFTQRE